MSLATENVSYIRQNRILDPADAANTHITIAGLGTVGSNAAMQLAKAGFKKFHLVDMDDIEPHNLPSQDFGISDIGDNKAEASAIRMHGITDELRVTTQNWEIMGGEIFPPGVLISAVDSMEIRKALFECAIMDPLIELFIDFRMGGNYMRAWSFNPQDERRAEQYKQTLHSSAESAEAMCGGRNFAPVGALCGAFATQMVTKHLRTGDHPPFHIDFDFDNFVLTTVGAKPLESD